MNSLDLVKLSVNSEFRNRVQAMLLSIAFDIVSESNITPYYIQRKQFASQILENVDKFVHRFAQALCVNPYIAQTIAIDVDEITLIYTGSQAVTSEFDGMDIEIKSVISSIYNDMIGILR